MARKARGGEDDLAELGRKELTEHHALDGAFEITQPFTRQTGVHHDRLEPTIGHRVGAQGITVAVEFDIIGWVEHGVDGLKVMWGGCVVILMHTLTITQMPITVCDSCVKFEGRIVTVLRQHLTDNALRLAQGAHAKSLLLGCDAV